MYEKSINKNNNNKKLCYATNSRESENRKKGEGELATKRRQTKYNKKNPSHKVKMPNRFRFIIFFFPIIIIINR